VYDIPLIFGMLIEDVYDISADLYRSSAARVAKFWGEIPPKYLLTKSDEIQNLKKYHYGNLPVMGEIFERFQI